MPQAPAVVLVVSLALLAPACTRNHPPVTVPSATPPVDQADALQRDLTAIFGEPAFNHSMWAVLVESTVSGQPLFELNPSKLMMPASNMKLLTLSAAAEMFGWDHTFETRLVSSAPLEGGTLGGDLVAIGGGDPSIGERGEPRGVLQSWAQQLWDIGVRAIDGRIIGDDDQFDDEGLVPGWSWDDIAYGFAAPSGALEYNEDSVDLVILAGATAGDPVSVGVRPGGSGLTIENDLVTSAESEGASLVLSRLPGSNDLRVAGGVPARTPEFVRTASVDNPTQFFVNALRAALVARGIRVSGDAVDIDAIAPRPDSSAARLLLSHRSPPLAQLAVTMMKFSQNVYAESLLKALAAREGIGTTDLGRRMVREILRTWGVYAESFVMADGSGLSRYNYVSAEALVRILQHLHEDPAHAEAFLPTLPIAGQDGTLSRRLQGTAGENNVRAKTGTLANVRALSGYVTTKDGEPLVFSIIANNFNVPAATIDEAADRALVRLATFTRNAGPIRPR
jgi:D-alanyl-D-alanine carboxypeptidase/D-alanyl-D-alanine-endopeptidase (penicillin-binding protein 4)